ncbi:MAG: type II toxin-antitoxin system VapC family toxin [Candidatus Methylacidiphilales bacterium]
MKVLLDTCSMLWALLEPRRLTARARAILENPDHEVVVSSISFWEISLKHSLGKLDIQGAQPEDFPTFVEQAGWNILSLSPQTAASFSRLPRSARHRDPFDRMLVWTAIHQELTLISRDRTLSEYQAFGLRLCH